MVALTACGAVAQLEWARSRVTSAFLAPIAGPHVFSWKEVRRARVVRKALTGRVEVVHSPEAERTERKNLYVFVDSNRWRLIEWLRRRRAAQWQLTYDVGCDGDYYWSREGSRLRVGGNKGDIFEFVSTVLTTRRWQAGYLCSGGLHYGHEFGALVRWPKERSAGRDTFRMSIREPRIGLHEVVLRLHAESGQYLPSYTLVSESPVAMQNGIKWVYDRWHVESDSVVAERVEERFGDAILREIHLCGCYPTHRANAVRLSAMPGPGAVDPIISGARVERVSGPVDVIVGGDELGSVWRAEEATDSVATARASLGAESPIDIRGRVILAILIALLLLSYRGRTSPALERDV